MLEVVSLLVDLGGEDSKSLDVLSNDGESWDSLALKRSSPCDGHVKGSVVDWVELELIVNLEVLGQVESEVKVSNSVGLESDVLGVLGWGNLGSLDSLSSSVGSSVDEVVTWSGADNKICAVHDVLSNSIVAP